MSNTDQKSTHATEAEARQVAEAAREKDWTGRTFIRNLFLGNFRLDAIDPYPDPEEFLSDRAKDWTEQLRVFLRDEVDSDAIDREGKRLATGDLKGRVRVWNIAVGELIYEFLALPSK